MIDIKDKKDCCGCEACKQICPRKCISMVYDTEGYLYPSVNKNECIDCSLCEKVCPVLSKKVNREPIHVYAAQSNDNNIVKDSSSGGIFSEISLKILEDNGVVFGAAFDKDFKVVHKYIEKTKDLPLLQTSKYVQSSIGESYIEVKKILDTGKKVLFTGTPCQIKGLKLFLRKEYSNLYCVDIICHGVPSPLIWKSYLDYITQKNKICKSDILKINFRDKTYGWNCFSFCITYNKSNKKKIFIEPLYKNKYLRVFISNIILRPSCYNCSFRNLNSESDLTIGDYWGVERFIPKYNKDNGVSCVIINSEKGNNLIKGTNIDVENSILGDVVINNKVILKSTKEPENRRAFMMELQNKNIISVINKYTKVNAIQKIRYCLIPVIKGVKKMVKCNKI